MTHLDYYMRILTKRTFGEQSFVSNFKTTELIK